MTSADRPQILELLATTLGWERGEDSARYFAWKHDSNPFGASPAWVALDGPRVVGFRTFLRWELVQHDVVFRAARAVDTATHPDYQRRGLFSRVTRHALRELTRDGTSLLFNTPNKVSRRGYLRLGWSDLGRFPVATRPCSWRGLARAARERTPANRPSLSADVGVAAADALADDDYVRRLIEAREPDRRLQTHVTTPFLRWRYGSDVISYRAVRIDDHGSSGLAIFRLRQRGSAREAMLCEVLVSPRSDRRLRADLARHVAAIADADYVIAAAAAVSWRAGFIRVPGRGPRVVGRALSDTTAVVARSRWALGAGDVELM